MKKRHALHDKAKQALELLLTRTCSSLNAAAITALGGKDTANEAQIKSLKRLFNNLGYNQLLAAARDSGTPTIKQAQILDLRARAGAALAEAEELYNELSILENNSDCFGTSALITDLTGIVGQYTDYHLDTVEIMTQGFSKAITRLLGNSWKTGDSARDEFGNELLSPTLTITIQVDPSNAQANAAPLSRSKGSTTTSDGTTILISETTPIDEENRRRNIDEWLKATRRSVRKARA